MVIIACVKHIILCSLKKSAESTGRSLFCVCVSLQFWNEIWGKTAFHLFYLQKKKKKRKEKSLLVIQICSFSHLSCSCSLSSGFHSIQVASADDQGIKSLLGRGEDEGSRRGERGREHHSLNISPAPARHASQPAVCSPLSFLFYHRAEKKINSYFHNPHSCLSTCLCVSPSSIPLFLSPPLSPLG